MNTKSNDPFAAKIRKANRLASKNKTGGGKAILRKLHNKMKLERKRTSV